MKIQIPLFCFCVILFFSCSKSSPAKPDDPVIPPVVIPPVDTNPDIYSVGSYNDFIDSGNGAYWKNDALHGLKSGQGASLAFDIAICNKDVYVVGEYMPSQC